MVCLIDKKCVPCQGGIPPLTQEASEKFLLEVNHDWTLNGSGHLYKKYAFPDFNQAMLFARHVAEIAEQEAHHPDLFISWGVCAIEIWTHKINGLTESDFILAAKINAIKTK